MENKTIEEKIKCPNCNQIGLIDTHIEDIFLCENCGNTLTKKEILKENKQKKED